MSADLVFIVAYAACVFGLPLGLERLTRSRRAPAPTPPLPSAIGHLGPDASELPHQRANCPGHWQIDTGSLVAWCDGCGARLSYEHDDRVLHLVLEDVRLRSILADIEAAGGEVTIIPGRSGREHGRAA